MRLRERARPGQCAGMPAGCGPGQRYGRPVLHGREPEQARLAALVDHARAGTAAVLIVLGEPGVGKTALLRELSRPPAGRAGRNRPRAVALPESSPSHRCRTPRCIACCVRSRTSTGCRPRRRGRCESRSASRTGPTVQPFLIGVATLFALTDAAELSNPVLCVVDDAQWLDPASADALLFAARQLSADPVAMVFAARTGDVGGVRPDRTSCARTRWPR